MHTLCLVNMPFADVRLPSLALAQLRSAVLARHSSSIAVKVAYANIDLAEWIGLPAYNFVTHSMRSLYSGLGDWFFRCAAFPELVDNKAEYFQRYFSRMDEDKSLIHHIFNHSSSSIERYLDRIIESYSLESSDIVAFTSMFMQNAASFALAGALKKRKPEIITVIGGANCEFPMGQVIADNIQAIDYVFSGPALVSFPLFIQHYLDGTLANTADISGVLVSKRRPTNSNTITIGKDSDINSRLSLDYTDFTQKVATLPMGPGEKPIFPFETSRGCWWGQRAHCTFCGLNGVSMAYRAMEPTIAKQQFAEMFAHSDEFKEFHAVDNILPKSYLTDVFPSLSPPRDVTIFYEVKADLSEKEIGVLSRARVLAIQPGIESLATSTLRLMRKGTTATQNVAFLKLCTLYGMKPAWNLLVGFPGEGVEVYQRYLDVLPLLAHLEPPAGVFTVRFDRFSPYHNRSADFGLNLTPMDFYSFVYPFDSESMKNFAYYFSDRNVLAGYSVAVAKWIRKMEKLVSDWRSRWAPTTGEMASNLYFTGDGSVVNDTRTGRLLQHRVGELGTNVLKYLRRPASKESVLKSFASSTAAEVEEAIGQAVEKGLVFEEGDHLLSLVLDGKRGAFGYRSESGESEQQFLNATGSTSPRNVRQLTVLQRERPLSA